MDNQNQLTFENDISYIEYKSIFKAIKEGRFQQAYELCEKALSLKIKIENLFLLMKSLKFWLGRKELYHQKKAGKEKYEYLIETWKEFENFTLKYQEYNHQIFYLFKYSIHEEICENTLIEYQNNQNEQSVLLILAENLVIIDKQDDALDLLLYAERKNENYFDYKRASLLSNLYAQKREASKSIFYITHCFINDWYLKKEKNYKLFENTDFLNTIQSMYIQGFNEKEIGLWVPIYIMLKKIPDKTFNNIDFYSCSKENVKNFLKKTIRHKEQVYENNNVLSNKLDFIFSCIFAVHFYLSISKTSKEDYLQIKRLLIIIKHLDVFIYTQLKASILKREKHTNPSQKSN